MRFILSIAVLLIIAPNILGQTHNIHDFGIWSGIEVKTKVLKKVKGSFKAQQRVKENTTQFSSTLFQTGLNYKLNKKLKVYGNYRHTFRYSKHTNRFDLRLGYKDKIIKRTWISTTLKNQFDKDTDSPSWNTLLRFKWGIEHKIKKKKIYPSITNEWFYELTGSGNYFSGYRINMGLTFDLPNKQELTIAYTHNQDLNKSFPKTDHIIGAFYSITL